MYKVIQNIFGIPVAFAQKASESDVTSETANQIAGLVGFILGQIPLWITAILVTFISFVVSRFVKAAVENKMTAEGFEEEHREIQIVASRTASAAVLIIGITVALKIAGIDLTPIIAAGAFGLGFASQDLIMNFIAGIMILTARQITIGDAIEVNGVVGKIIEIQTRSTIIKTFDGKKVIIPNSDLFSNKVTNFSANPLKRIDLVNGVAYGSDLKQTMKVVKEAVKNTPGVLASPKPSVNLFEWGDYSINFKIRAWADKKSGWVKVRNHLIMNINQALEDAGIEIPYPIQTIYLSKEGNDEKVEKMLMEEQSQKPQIVHSDNMQPHIENEVIAQVAESSLAQQSAPSQTSDITLSQPNEEPQATVIQPTSETLAAQPEQTIAAQPLPIPEIQAQQIQQNTLLNPAPAWLQTAAQSFSAPEQSQTVFLPAPEQNPNPSTLAETPTEQTS